MSTEERDMKDTLELTLEKAKSMVDDAIRDKGSDFVYKRMPGMDCKYVHEGVVWDADIEEYVSDESVYEPGCIVGYVLHKAGIPLATLQGSEGNNAEELLDRLERHGLVKVETEAADFLNSVQDLQDSGNSWGSARDQVLTDSEDEEEDLSCDCGCDDEV